MEHVDLARDMLLFNRIWKGGRQMLRSLKDMGNYTVSGTDGEIGRVSDFYFDDQRWTVRYLVVDTGDFWHGSHRVLVSPVAFHGADWGAKVIHLALSRDTVRNSPTVDLDKPVSRQYERDYFRYYGWPHYWGYGGIWGQWGYPGDLRERTWIDTPDEDNDPHLRSMREVLGYRIQGSDEEVGHVEDLIVDDVAWTIRYLAVDTRNWLPGKKVLVALPWIDQISWPESTVSVKLLRETIKNSPEWRPAQPINREYEAALYDHYGRPTYWTEQTGTEREVGPTGAGQQPRGRAKPSSSRPS